MSYSLVIFDFDGTLADSFGLFLESMNAAAAEQGFATLDADRLESARALDARSLLAELGIPLWKLPAVTRAIRRAAQRRIGEVALFDGVPDLLRDLRRLGIRTAIVSSNSRANVEHVLGSKHAAMIDHFGCDAAIFGKRVKLRAALRALQLPATATLCVGDEQRDAEAAAGLGLAFLGVGWGFAMPQALAPLSIRAPVQHPREILDVVLGAAPP